MTGEMCAIDQEGLDSNGDTWELHAAIAQAVGGELHPFDVYQGPYISVGGNVTVGNAPYTIPAQLPGIVRLWLVPDEHNEGFLRVYREDIDTLSWGFWYDDKNSAIEAAGELLC